MTGVDSDAARQRIAWANVKPTARTQNYTGFLKLPVSLQEPRRALRQQLKHFRAVATQYKKNPETVSQASNSPQPELGVRRDAAHAPAPVVRHGLLDPGIC